MDLAKKAWLLRSKARFFFKPVSRRVRLEIVTDGRHLAYLLTSLHALGYGVQVVESPMLFRELLYLRKSSPIPFLFGGSRQKCALVISDRKETIEMAGAEGMKTLFLDCSFFGNHFEKLRMPYFMHPSVYYNGLHQISLPDAGSPRLVRLGFFGTRDANFYTRDFHFPMMNREQILESFCQKFGDQIVEVKTPIEGWEKQRIVVSLDSRGGDRDRQSKSFLPQAEYLNTLRSCDFFLSPPGWCMPLSHNLIEGMASGAIPIINSPRYLHPNLEHGVNALVFSTTEELGKMCDEALSMPVEQIEKMRCNVIQYYNEYLKPGEWLAQALKCGVKSILVNAEELSIKK